MKPLFQLTRQLRFRIAISSMFIWTFLLLPVSAWADCGPTWLNSRPVSIYKDAPFRLHFYTAEWNKDCIDTMMSMNGKTFDVVLDGESTPIKLLVNTKGNGPEIFQEIGPADGDWGSRTDVSFSLSQINADCYPFVDSLNMSITSAPVPVANMLKSTLKDLYFDGAAGMYIELEMDPGDMQFLYWGEVTPTKYNHNDGEIPLMIAEYSPITHQAVSGKSLFISMEQKDNWMIKCSYIYSTKLCTDYSVTVYAVDLLDGKSVTTEPITVKFGVPSKGSDWKLGDPLNCDGYDAGVDVDTGIDSGIIDTGIVDGSSDGGFAPDSSVRDAGGNGGSGGCSCTGL